MSNWTAGLIAGLAVAAVGLAVWLMTNTYFFLGKGITIWP